MHRAEIRLRLAALDQAVRVVTSHEANSAGLIELAQQMYDWLTIPPAPAHLALILGGITRQDDNQEIPVQIHDDEQFTLTVNATDAKGFAVTDANLAWTVDNTAVASLQVSTDLQTATVVAGTPGSAVVTLTDSVSGLTVTEAVDVVAAGVALITLAEGTVTKQAPATPAPASAATTDPATAPVETPAPVADPSAPVDTTTAPAAPVETNPAGTPAV
jgi:hypothetical protein